MKKFTNTTNKEFTCSWDGKEQTFLPGESAILDNGVAEAFAKHLANIKFEGTLVASDQTFIDEMNKYLSDPTESTDQTDLTEETVAGEITEQIFIEAEKEIDESKEEEKIEKAIKKMVEPKKKEKKGRKTKKEIFEGLDNETNI